MKNAMYGFTYRGYRLRECEIEEKNEGFYTELLDRINDLLCCSRENYSKPFFVWFVLKFPAESRFAKRNDNEVFCKFMEALRKSYMEKSPTRSYHPDGRARIPLPLYIWARELSDSGQYHYHVTIVLNGQIGQDPQSVFYRARDLWAGCINRAAKAEDLMNGTNDREVTEYFYPESIPMDFGDSDYRDLESGKLSPLSRGGYRIEHWKNHETVVADYHTLYEFLSYYAKVYSKIRNEDLIRKTKSFGCSQMPRYREIIDEIDLIMRGNK